MQVLVELAIYRHAISIRDQSIPVGLPAVWSGSAGSSTQRPWPVPSLTRTTRRAPSPKWPVRLPRLAIRPARPG